MKVSFLKMSFWTSICTKTKVPLNLLLDDHPVCRWLPGLLAISVLSCTLGLYNIDMPILGPSTNKALISGHQPKKFLFLIDLAFLKKIC